MLRLIWDLKPLVEGGPFLGEPHTPRNFMSWSPTRFSRWRLEKISPMLATERGERWPWNTQGALSSPTAFNANSCPSASPRWRTANTYGQLPPASCITGAGAAKYLGPRTHWRTETKLQNYRRPPPFPSHHATARPPGEQQDYTWKTCKEKFLVKTTTTGGNTSRNWSLRQLQIQKTANSVIA